LKTSKGLTANMGDNALECTAVLFDLDGVLIDSSACITRHWKEWAERNGLELQQVMQVAHGYRAIETIRAVAPQLDAEVEARWHLRREVEDHDGVTVIEGAQRLLAGLPAGAWGIVTSGSTELAKARLAYVSLPIPEVLVTADDVRQGKPSPEPYLRGAEGLGMAAEHCIVIEDAPAGIRAGKRAGMRVIGIASTHQREELLREGADFAVKQLADLEIQATPPPKRLRITLHL
jgi:sugar-phosphatase